MNISLNPSFLLHTRPYRESSLLLELFTKDHGRIALVARGVRKNRSRLRPLLQPFIPLLISWQGRGELMNLIDAEANGPSINLSGDHLLSGFYLNELLMRVLQKQDPHPALYTIYQQSLLELHEKNRLEKTLRLFEKKLLDELGYGLQLEHTISAEKHYHFYPDAGFKLSEVESLPTIFSGRSLLSLARNELDDETSLKDAKRLMRLALAPILGSQPLQSRKLFTEVSKE